MSHQLSSCISCEISLVCILWYRSLEEAKKNKESLWIRPQRGQALSYSLLVHMHGMQTHHNFSCVREDIKGKRD